MNKKTPIAILVVLALLLSAMPAAAFTSPSVVEYKAHDTATEFENAKMLNNLKVKNGKVVLGEGTTKHSESFEDDGTSDWTVYYDNPSLWGTGTDSSSYTSGDTDALYRPGSQDWDNLLLYNDFGTDGKTGTISMIGYIEVTDFDDGTKGIGGFRLVNSSTGAFYQLVISGPGGGNDFRLSSSQGGKNAGVNHLAPKYGNYEEGAYIKMEILYDYSTNELTGNVYYLGESSPKWSKTVTTNNVPHPDAFGLFGAGPGGSGSDYYEYDDLTMKAGTPQTATYMSKAYTIENPTNASVTFDTLKDATATITVVDGQGNQLGSKQVTSSGTHQIDLSPSAQVGEKAHVRVEVEDTGTEGEIGFKMSREAISFVDDPPSATLDSPTGGKTIYTNTPKLTASIDDAEFSLAQGDSVTVEWYLDGTKVAEQSGVTSAQQVSYEPAALSEGSHKWNVRVVDKYGGEYQTSNTTFTVDHKAPNVDNSTADPSGGEDTPYASNTLSINISDYDFAHDGDSLDVGWYVDGSLVHEDTGITSNGTVSYTTDKLAEGTHTWHIEVADDWGNSQTSDTFTYEIKHVAPNLSELSPDGLTHYETNTLSVNVTDGDFDASGDSVDVAFYVDGAKVNTQTITSNQVVTYDAGPYADGNYTWHVEAVDDYGYKTVSADQWLNISHYKPDVSNPTLDGRTRYENNTLGVDITDGDFPLDGDSLDVGIYVNGSQIKSTTISSNGTVTVDAGPYADGNYTWHVEVADDYGYKTTKYYTLNITHDKTEVSNPSINGLTHYENNTLSVDIADYDFAYDGDTVDVGFYVNGSLVNEQTVTANGTVSYDAGPYVDGNYTWHVEAVGDYGHTTVTQKWWLNISHDAPTADTSVLKPNGTIYYENANLTIGLTDGDFPRDGDSVDIYWYVDGELEAISEVSQNGTYYIKTPALADGSHKWRVEFRDDYGYVTGISNHTFTVKHFPTQIDNSTASPTGVIKTQKPTFKIDISDRDFAYDGDSVDMGLYLNSTNTNGYKLIGVDTLYANGTAEVTPDDPISGDADYFWKAVGDYGHVTYSDNFTIEAPNTLYLHSVTRPYEQLNNTASLSVITGSNETTDLDKITDGSVEFGDLPKGETYVFSITADGYYQRGVYVSDLYSRSVIFLIDANQSVVSTTLTVEDRSGNYRKNPIILIETVINTSKVSNMPDNGPEWVVVGGDRLGANNQLLVTLREGGRYRFTVKNTNGDSRTLGYYTAKTDATVNLEIGTINYPAPNEHGYTWTAYTNQSDSGQSVTFAYNDLGGYTENVSVTLTLRDSGAVIASDTFQAGTYGEAVAKFPVNKSTYKKDMVVKWSAMRNGTKITGKRIISGRDYSKSFPLGDMWLKIVYGLAMLMLAFAGAFYTGPAGMLIVLGLGSALATLLGIAPAALGMGASVLTIAMGAMLQRRKPTQPQ